MAYVASGVGDKIDPDMDQSIGNGRCVAYVQKVAGCQVTSQWSKGANDRSSTSIAVGTAIATFQGGSSGNYTDGRSRAAIYIGVADKPDGSLDGLIVHHRWKNATKTQPVHQRAIHFKGGQGEPRNGGDAHSIVEPASLLRRFKSLLRRSRLMLSG